MEKIYSMREAAAAIGVYHRTLRDWDLEGRISSAKRGAGGMRIYTQSEVDAIRKWYEHRLRTEPNLRNVAGSKSAAFKR